MRCKKDDEKFWHAACAANPTSIGFSMVIIHLTSHIHILCMITKITIIAATHYTSFSIFDTGTLVYGDLG